MLNQLINFLLPSICSICNSNTAYICNQCLKKLHLNLQQSTLNSVDHYYLSSYCKNLRKLFSNSKFEGQSKSLNYLSKHISQQELLRTLADQYDFWVPVPYHKRKAYKRGFNVIELLFNTAFNTLKIKKHNCLERIKYTQPLFDLNDNQRKAELRDAIKLQKKKRIILENSRVLLIDDIVTTGATMKACISELKKIPLKKLSCLSLIKA